MMTPDELLKLAISRIDYDGLIDPDTPERGITLPEGLLILGSSEAAGDSHTADDLYIQIEGDGLRLFWRDPRGTPQQQSVWGREWEMNSHFNRFEDLRAFAYTI